MEKGLDGDWYNMGGKRPRERAFCSYKKCAKKPALVNGLTLLTERFCFLVKLNGVNPRIGRSFGKNPELQGLFGIRNQFQILLVIVEGFFYRSFGALSYIAKPKPNIMLT